MPLSASDLTREERFLLRRILEIQGRVLRSGQRAFTSFIPPGLLPVVEGELVKGHPKPQIFRVSSSAEYAMIGFDPDEKEIEVEDYPIVVLEIGDVGGLSHRDILGSAMHLGIKRETFGDIFLSEASAFLVSTENMAAFLMENLRRIGNREILLKQQPLSVLDHLEEGGEAKRLVVASTRLDLLISRAFNLSRGDAQALFTRGRVKLNHMMTTQYKQSAQPDDLISVRGYGRLRLEAVAGTTRKGNLSIEITLYR